MRRRVHIEIGTKYGKWTVLREAATRDAGRYWLCQCECGVQRELYGYNLAIGKTNSCIKCRPYPTHNVTHGMTKSGMYYIWGNMVGRCTNPQAGKWDRYGGRGIAVCDRWREFENFYADMAPRPSLSHSLDRINNDAGYSPENCRWATQKEQCRNRSNNKWITLNGVTKKLFEWCEEIGISPKTFRSRLRLGWSEHDALHTPVNQSVGRYDRSNVAMRRKKMSYSARLAAALCSMIKEDGSPLIPQSVRDQGVKAILAHIQWDHIVPVAVGGGNHPSNLQPLTKEDHLVKTKRDVKEIAKGKRIQREQEEFRRRLLAKQTGEEAEATPRRKALIQGSKGTAFRKKINGRVERRG